MHPQADVPPSAKQYMEAILARFLVGDLDLALRLLLPRLRCYNHRWDTWQLGVRCGQSEAVSSSSPRPVLFWAWHACSSLATSYCSEMLIDRCLLHKQRFAHDSREPCWTAGCLQGWAEAGSQREGSEQAPPA